MSKGRKIFCIPELNRGKFNNVPSVGIRAVIEQEVSLYFDIEAEKLPSKSRKREYAFSRQICMYLLLNYTKYSLKKIASFYNRDHTTVIHANQVIEDFLSQKNNTPEKSLINQFLYRYGYKGREMPVKENKEVIIDAHY